MSDEPSVEKYRDLMGSAMTALLVAEGKCGGLQAERDILLGKFLKAQAKWADLTLLLQDSQRENRQLRRLVSALFVGMALSIALNAIRIFV